MIKKFVTSGLGSFYLIVTQSLGYLFITHLLIRYLPPIYASAWFLFISIALFVSIFDFGLSPTLSREIGFSHGNEGLDKKRLLGTIYTAVSLNTIMAFVLLLVGIIGGGAYLHHVFPKVDYPIISHAYFYFLFGTFFMFLSNPFFAVHYGFGHVATERFLRSLSWLLAMLLLYIGVKCNLSFPQLGMLWLTQGVIVHFIARVYTIVKFKLHFLSVYIDYKQLPLIIGPSLKWAVMSFGAILILQTSNFVIASALKPELIAQYAPLMQLATAIMTLGGVVQLALVPMVSKLMGKGEHQKIRGILLFSSRTTLCLVLLPAICLLCWGGEIVHFWLGAAFHYSFGIMVVLLIMSVLESHHVSCAAVVMATGYIKFMIPALLSGVLTLVFSVCFAHYWGLVGVALGVMCAQLMTNNWYAVFVSLRCLHVSAGSFFYNLLPVFFYAIILFGVGCLLSYWHQSVGLWMLLFNLLILSMVAAIFLMLLYWKNISGFCQLSRKNHHE